MKPKLIGLDVTQIQYNNHLNLRQTLVQPFREKEELKVRGVQKEMTVQEGCEEGREEKRVQ